MREECERNYENFGKQHFVAYQNVSHSFTASIQTIYIYTKVKNTFALCASNKWYCKILFLSLRNDQELRFAHL